MFTLTRQVRIRNHFPDCEPVRLGVERFRRDLSMTLADRPCAGELILEQNRRLPAEGWRISFPDSGRLVLDAADPLGAVYGLLFISRRFLGIWPFWFWQDQTFIPQNQVHIPCQEYLSPAYAVRYRGWFLNDEVLLDAWTAGQDNQYVWEMAFEALLRCGGNTVIPGTHENAQKNRSLACAMGLRITHHHAEPLGAPMFSQRYPDQTASFAEHPELFIKLWQEGIQSQKDLPVLWNLGFRGQGDRPFWDDDPRYHTPRARGELISRLIGLQYSLVREAVPGALCCTNLYGEMMELYRDGYISLPEDVICLWADNGYGRMVSRRQGLHDPRISSLPDPSSSGAHGLYYHASFYDLQAASHVTQLSAPPERVAAELEKALNAGANCCWIINASNIKPHLYTLSLISELWRHPVSVSDFSERYLTCYYGAQGGLLSAPLQKYYRCMIAFGPHWDQRAGEQFYTYLTRMLSRHWLLGAPPAACPDASFCLGRQSYAEQIACLTQLLRPALPEMYELERELDGFSAQFGERLLDTFWLQIRLHRLCCQGALLFCRAWDFWQNEDDKGAFACLSFSIEAFTAADQTMRGREHDVWKNFYANECLADIKFTAYCLRGLRFLVRSRSDGPHFYQWQRDFSTDRDPVVLITNMRNHLTDDELWLQMKPWYKEMNNYGE